MTRQITNPRTEALAFRIWQHCNQIGWNCTMRECARALGEPIARVRRVCAMKGWTGRLRASGCDVTVPLVGRGARSILEGEFMVGAWP